MQRDLSCPPSPRGKSRKAYYSSIMMTSLKVQALTLSVFNRPRRCAGIISRLLHTVHWQLTVWFKETSLYCKFTAFQFAHQQVFATSPKSCSNDLTGGWWFNDGHNSNLNGQFMGNTKAYTGIGWVRFKHNFSLKFVEMKMRAQSFLKEKENEREKWDKWRWELSPSWKKKRMKGRNETNEDESSVLPERKRGWKGEMRQMKMRT